VGKWDGDTIKAGAVVVFFGALAYVALRVVLAALRLLAAPTFPAIP